MLSASVEWAGRHARRGQAARERRGGAGLGFRGAAGGRGPTQRSGSKRVARRSWRERARRVRARRSGRRASRTARATYSPSDRATCPAGGSQTPPRHHQPPCTKPYPRQLPALPTAFAGLLRSTWPRSPQQSVPPAESETPGMHPGTAYPPTALPTVAPYALPVPGLVPSRPKARASPPSRDSPHALNLIPEIPKSSTLN